MSSAAPVDTEQERFKRARLAMARGDYREALALYRGLEGRDPRFEQELRAAQTAVNVDGWAVAAGAVALVVMVVVWVWGV